jgi:hypothetical protein
MTGTVVLGSEIDRRGGSFFYAAEGTSEVPIRFQAAIEHRCRGLKPLLVDPTRAPFTWLTPEKLPLNLFDPGSVERFIQQVLLASAEMESRFGLPLVMIFIDTYVATAGFRKSGDEGDPVINAKIMRDGLRLIAQRTRTFTFAVDHFGKEVEAATRGSSAKEDNSDVLLALLGTKDISGIIVKNPRVVVRKVRGGVQGRVCPFSTKVTYIGKETTLVLDWAKVEEGAGAQTDDKKKREWGKGEGMGTLRRVLSSADPARATTIYPWCDSPKQSVRAFPREHLKDEFMKVYPGSGDTPEARKENARSAFNTAVKTANKRELIGVLNTDENEWIWNGGKLERQPDLPPQEDGEAA